ncbi:MAG: choice-of-anchor Q domain-containing protein [Pirellulales bacterium]
MASDLDAYLESQGVANNRYGLVGFGTDQHSDHFPHIHLLGTSGQRFSSDPADLADAANDLVSSNVIGDAEDGWGAIELALAEYDFREGAAVHLVLITDEIRAATENFENGELHASPIEREGTAAALQASNATLSAFVSAEYALYPYPFPEPPAMFGIDAALPTFGLDADQVDGKVDGIHNARILVPGFDTLQVNYQSEHATGASPAYVATNRGLRFFDKFSGSGTPTTEPYDESGFYEFESQFQSNPALPPPFFEDISASHFTINPGDGENESFQLTSTQLAGFTFSFCKELYDSLFVNTNGTITFDYGVFPNDPNDPQPHVNKDWSEVMPTQNTLAPLWDDLKAGPNGQIWYKILDEGNFNERLVIQWNNFQYAPDYAAQSSQTITFQAVLFSSPIEATSEIYFSYKDLSGAASGTTGGKSSTVGITADKARFSENFGGDVMQWSGGPFNFLPQLRPEYMDLAWETGGTVWDLKLLRDAHDPMDFRPDVIQAYSQAFFDSLVDISVAAAADHRTFHDGDAWLEVNLGSNGADPQVGDFLNDDDVPGLSISGTLGVVNDDSGAAATIRVSSNSIASEITPTQAQQLFRTARMAAGAGGNLLLDFNENIMPDGEYVVELFFADNLAPNVEDETFEVIIEGELMMGEIGSLGRAYNIASGVSWIENFDGELGPPNGQHDVKALGLNAGIVKRYFVDVNDADGLQINLKPLLDPFSGLPVPAQPKISAVRILTLPCNLMGDYNGNETVDAADYVVWRNMLGVAVTAGTSADGDGDGVVDGDDYDVWKAHFGTTCENSTPDPLPIVHADFNADGMVDAADFDIWSDDYGSTTELEADANDNGIVDLADLAEWQAMFHVTTLDEISGDFNDDGVVDSADHDVWTASANQYVTPGSGADADGDGYVDEADLAIMEDDFGITHARMLPHIMNADSGMPLEITGQAPHVVNVVMSGSTSTHAAFAFAGVVGSGGQLRTVPVGGLDTLSIQFSEEVYVTEDALVLHGLGGQSIPTVEAFSYDLETQTGSWQFDQWLPAGQYLIVLNDSVFDLDREALDGEFTNPWSLAETAGYASTFPSGDGTAGGDFRFRFTNLPADFTHDNIVDYYDYYGTWYTYEGSEGATHDMGDADGDGYVGYDDYWIWAQEYYTSATTWPSVEPGMILTSTLIDENDGNYTLNDLSLREALVIAAANSGADTIVFKPGMTGTIALSSGLTINSDVEIKGPGAGAMTVNAQNVSGVFTVNSGKTATLRGLTIRGGNGAGGAIYSFGHLTVDRVYISDNYGGYTGGIYQSGGTITVSNSTIANNYGYSTGGGISLTSSAVGKILNTTISGNSAAYGAAGLFVGSSTLDIINCTVTGNSAAYAGGGIYATSSTVTMHNTIVAGNTLTSGSYVDVYGVFQSSSSHNLIGVIDGSSGLASSTSFYGTESNPLNAGLTALGNYGGPTLTHALLEGSAAIDAGDDAIAAMCGLLTDQRGEDRIDDGDGSSGERIDIGAFELAADEYFGSL